MILYWWWCAMPLPRKLCVNANASRTCAGHDVCLCFLRHWDVLIWLSRDLRATARIDAIHILCRRRARTQNNSSTSSTTNTLKTYTRAHAWMMYTGRATWRGSTQCMACARIHYTSCCPERVRVRTGLRACANHHISPCGPQQIELT